jgi:hypothetical protein
MTRHGSGRDGIFGEYIIAPFFSSHHLFFTSLSAFFSFWSGFNFFFLLFPWLLLFHNRPPLFSFAVARPAAGRKELCATS